MKALFVSFLASNYDTSVGFYRNAVGLALLRESEARPHRFINFDLGGLILKVFEWIYPWHGTGLQACSLKRNPLMIAWPELGTVMGRQWLSSTTHGPPCCTVRGPFSDLFDLIDAHQTGDE